MSAEDYGVERSILDFVEGRASAKQLAGSLASVVDVSGDSSRYRLGPELSQPVSLGGSEIVRLIDAFEAGDLSLSDLRVIGFAVLVSDQYTIADGLDGLGVFEVLHDWAVPQGRSAEPGRAWREWLRPPPNHPTKKVPVPKP